MKKTLISTGKYGSDYRITVDGVVYGFHVRNAGNVSQIFIVSGNGRSGLRNGSAQFNKVLTAIEQTK